MSLRNFQIGTAVSLAYGEGGFLGVQTDGFGEDPGVNGRHVVGMFGLVGRPLDATNDNGALTLFSDEGPEGFAWIGFDGRDAEKCPPLSSGSVAVVNSRGAYQLLDYETETVTLYVPIAGGSKAHLLQIGNSSDGKPVVDLRHASGVALVMLENSVTIKNAAGDAYIELNDSGIVLNGNTKAVGGLDVGGGTALPLALAPALVSYLSALEGLLTGLATAIDSKLAPTPGVSVAAVTAFIGSAAALKIALAATLTKGL